MSQPLQAGLGNSLPLCITCSFTSLPFSPSPIYCTLPRVIRCRFASVHHSATLRLISHSFIFPPCHSLLSPIHCTLPRVTPFRFPSLSHSATPTPPTLVTLCHSLLSPIHCKQPRVTPSLSLPIPQSTPATPRHGPSFPASPSRNISYKQPPRALLSGALLKLARTSRRMTNGMN